MARDYQRLLHGPRSRGVTIPRWIAVLVPVLFVVLVGFRILVPPSFIVQRIDAPDGGRSARLERSRYADDHFIVYVRDQGWRWRTRYYSAALPEDFRIDLGERLAWSPDGSQLAFRMQGACIWGYDFEQDRPLTADERSAAGAWPMP